MKIRTIKNWLILGFLIAYIILYNFFIFQNYMRYSGFITTSFLTIILALSIMLLGFRKDKITVLGKNVFKIVIIYIIVTFVIMYGIGIISGTLTNTYVSSFNNIFNNIFIPIIIVFLIELIRYIFISANKDKKIVLIILTILLILFELSSTIITFNIVDFASTFNIIATIILPCILKNLLLSYLAYNVGYRIPIFYRLTMDMYLLVVPTLPNLSNYINSMISISLPVLIYISTHEIIEDSQNRLQPVVIKRKISIFDALVTIVVILLVASVSGFFPHYMIGIGSNSMRPIISKGDAVILEKINSKTKLKKGDIIAYSSGKITIVHRIKNVIADGNKETYIVKGDANNGADPKPISRKQVKGIYKFKISYIAWPTVWLTELFNS